MYEKNKNKIKGLLTEIDLNTEEITIEEKDVEKLKQIYKTKEVT